MTGPFDARIEELLLSYDELGISRQLNYDRLHLCTIITHSTAIEGSTITLEENELMFEEGVVPAGKSLVEQLMNLDLRSAYEVGLEVARAGDPVTVPLLRALAALVLKNTGAIHHTAVGSYDDTKGDLRLQNVTAGRGGRSYLGWEKVKDSLGLFCSWLNDGLAGIGGMGGPGVYELSFEAHCRLVSIHPWADGNGRVSRLLMNMVQVSGGVVPTYVRLHEKAGYLSSLAGSQAEGNPGPSLGFMASQAIALLEDEIGEYRASVGADPMGDVRGQASLAGEAIEARAARRVLATDRAADEAREGLGSGIDPLK